MKIISTHLRDLSINIQLAEEERFDVDYTGYGAEAQKNLRINVFRLRAHVDLRTGDVSVTGYGFLRNKSGEVGERNRDVHLTPATVPEAAKGLVAEEVRLVRQSILTQQGVEW